MKKRMKPYTAIGIRRKKCIRCGKQATEQWSICALGGRFVPICRECDFLLNAVVLQFVGWPNQLSTMLKYQKEKE